MFNFIDINIFIPVSGCLGRAPVHCFAWGPMMLLRRPCLDHPLMWITLSHENERVNHTCSWDCILDKIQ